MPRAIWKGSISFGLVNAPVAMYAAISERNLHFHLVHKTDMAPIGYQKTCKRHKKPVPDKEIARAFNLKGKTVLLEDRDFEAARAEGYHAITVLDFVPLDQIDPIQWIVRQRLPGFRRLQPVASRLGVCVIADASDRCQGHPPLTASRSSRYSRYRASLRPCAARVSLAVDPTNVT
jgi:hypothetical protein